MRNCEQHLCDLRATGKCPVCSCGATSDIVSDTCEFCWCCEKEQGYIRGGNNKSIDVEQKIGIIVIQPTTGE